MPEFEQLGIKNAIFSVVSVAERLVAMPTPEQVRAARAWLGLSQDEFVAVTGIPKRTLARLELAESMPYENTLERVREALVGMGVELLFEGGVAVGIRVKPRHARRLKRDAALQPPSGRKA